MSTTRLTCQIRAERSEVYRKLVDPAAIARWKVPASMSCEVHAFDARVGGRLRVSLTYDEPSGQGKTSAHTDTYHGRFVELVPNERVVEIDEFETDDPALQGEMTITITLHDVVGGTELRATHAGLPTGVRASDNELGWREALSRLTALLEAEHDVER